MTKPESYQLSHGFARCAFCAYHVRHKDHTCRCVYYGHDTSQECMTQMCDTFYRRGIEIEPILVSVHAGTQGK